VRGGSSTAAPTRPTATTCASTSPARARGTSATICRGASSCITTTWNTAPCCPISTWASSPTARPA